jgi:hypothetical protein
LLNNKAPSRSSFSPARTRSTSSSRKTAVAPLVEVRDRNNNPVSGVAVTFAVQGGKAAAFQGGAATMTVATNAAGQAVAAGFTPLTAGAVNISVEAAIQGQVVTAAITQVNVMTAAEAAAARPAPVVQAAVRDQAPVPVAERPVAVVVYRRPRLASSAESWRRAPSSGRK